MNLPARSLLAAALGISMTACAVRGPGAATPQQLAEAGNRELARAREGDELAPPPGLDPKRVQPAEAEQATMPLSSVLQRLLPQREAGVAAPPGEDDHREALKRYAAGRALLREGEARSAAEQLAAATSLDPGAGEVWILRAEAELASGQRSSGERSLQRGVALGAGGAVHREALAREAIEQRRFKEAASLLTEARSMDPRGESPELALVIDAELGVALEELGYDAAARELLLGVAPALADAAPVGRFAPLIASAIRQQARYWTLIGDLSCRLGDYAGAFEAYRQAEAAPGGSHAGLAPAQVYAALRAGAPSHAAAIAMEAVDESGNLEHSGAALLAYVAGASERAGAAIQRVLAARLEGAEGEAQAQGGLAMALAALQPPSKAQRTLLRAHAASPHNVELIRAVARSAAGGAPDEAAQLGAQMIRAAPMRTGAIALAILRAHRETDAVIASAAGAGDPASRLLAAWMLHFTGRPDQGLSALGPVHDPALAAVANATRAQLAASAGDWDELDQAIAALADDETPQGRRALALALGAGQRYAEALATMSPVVESPDPPRGALTEAAMLARRAGEPELALQWLQRALAADPRDEAAHDLRMQVLSATFRDDRERVADAVADLQRMMPGSAPLGLLEASVLASQGRQREAQERLLALAEDPLRADDALAAAQDLWTNQRRIDRELLEQAHDWLAARAPQRPQSPATARALATVLVELDRSEQASEALRTAIDRYPWPELHVALEEVLRSALGRSDEADQLALQRLTTGPAGIDELMQLAALQARRGELAKAAAAARRIPPSVHLTAQQAQRLIETARLSAEAVGRTPGASAADAAAIFDEVERLGGAAPTEFHEWRLDLLTAWGGAAPDRIARALAYAARQLDEGAGRLAGAVAGALDQAGRGADGLATFEALAEMDEPLSIGAVDAWFIMVARSGDIDDARRFVEAARKTGLLCQALRLRRFNVQEGDSEVDCAVLALVALADHWEAEGRPGQMLQAYRLAWSLKPGDPGTANDLGYMLLEARQDLDEAARLIELAYAGEPDSGHVLDSIGWLRYRQGIFEDARGPGGEVVTGAVTFLERAAATPRGQVSATIQDHLGDALWRVGRRPAARLAWQTARNLAGNQADGQAAAISMKLRDALRGQEPQLAEVYEEFARHDGGG